MVCNVSHLSFSRPTSDLRSVGMRCFFLVYSSFTDDLQRGVAQRGAEEAVIAGFSMRWRGEREPDSKRAVNTIHGEVNRARWSRDLIMMRKMRRTFGASFEERLRPPSHAFIQNAFIQSPAGDWMKKREGHLHDFTDDGDAVPLSWAQRPICRLTAFSC